MAWLGSCLGPPHSRYIMIIVLIERCGWKCDTKPQSGPPTVCLLALKSADLPGLWLSMIPLITHLNASVPMLVSLLSHTLKPLIGKLNETDDLITAQHSSGKLPYPGPEFSSVRQENLFKAWMLCPTGLKFVVLYNYWLFGDCKMCNVKWCHTVSFSVKNVLLKDYRTLIVLHSCLKFPDNDH